MDEITMSKDEYKIISEEEYSPNLIEIFQNIPDIAKTLLDDAKLSFKKIENMLYSTPGFVNAVKASIPEEAFQAVLSKEQKNKIANGALELMTKKDGTLMANLVDPQTHKIVSTIPLKSVKLTPELTKEISNYATQIQMTQIAEQIHNVQMAVEEVRFGQEYDRLAAAYSCQQKLLQAMEIKNPELRSIALLRIAYDSEDSRNLLMRSQNANVEFIKNQPESFFGKIVFGATPEKINSRINEIRESLCALNMVSLTEAMAYKELGEKYAARKSLEYYAEYINKTYLSSDGLLQRLDMIDPSKENYWSETLPDIEKKIKELPCEERTQYIEEGDDENGEML